MLWLSVSLNNYTEINYSIKQNWHKIRTNILSSTTLCKLVRIYSSTQWSYYITVHTITYIPLEKVQGFTVNMQTFLQRHSI